MADLAYLYQSGDLGMDINSGMSAETPACALGAETVTVPSLGLVQTTAFYGGGYTNFRLELSNPTFTPYGIDGSMVPLHPFTLDRFQDPVNGDPFSIPIFSFTGVGGNTFHDFGMDTGVTFVGLGVIAFRILLSDTAGAGNLTVTVNIAALAPLSRGLGVE